MVEPPPLDEEANGQEEEPWDLDAEVQKWVSFLTLLQIFSGRHLCFVIYVANLISGGGAGGGSL